MKLYRSRNYPTRGYAYVEGTGWLMFPVGPDGWERRERARGLDPVDIREVPVTLAFPNGAPSFESQPVAA
jgi:hypothetical protein